jgi:hypothetical protein
VPEAEVNAMPAGNDPKLAETLDAPVYEPPKAGPFGGGRRWLVLATLVLLAGLGCWLAMKLTFKNRADKNLVDPGPRRPALVPVRPENVPPAPSLPDPVSTEVDGLRFTLAAVRPPNAGPDRLDLTLTARNTSAERLVVLRYGHAAVLKIEGDGARFQGLPMTPVPPWTDARAIAPGEEAVVGAFSLANCQAMANYGGWLLRPGRYQVSVAYAVTPALLPSAEERKRLPGMMPEGKVWLGSATCGPIKITVVPPKPAPGGAAGGPDAGSR